MLNKSNIEEANKHLQALYTKVQELEQAVQEQHEALVAKDSFIQTKLRELASQDVTIRQQADEIRQRDELILHKDQTILELESSHQLKDKEISVLSKRSDVLKKVLSFIPDLKSVISKMDDVSAGLQDDCGLTGGHNSGSASPNSAADADNTVKLKSSPQHSQTENISFQLVSPNLKSAGSGLIIGEADRPITPSGVENAKLKEIYF